MLDLLRQVQGRQDRSDRARKPSTLGRKQLYGRKELERLIAVARERSRRAENVLRACEWRARAESYENAIRIIYGSAAATGGRVGE
jgi:hypothetical protein